MPTAFTRTVEQAQEAGFTPTRRTVSIVAVKQLTAGIVRLTFRDEYIAHHVRPAQFVNLYSSNPMHLMPRPFGVSEVDGDEVSLIFAVVGFGTDEFSKLTAGDTIDVLGPLGTPFNLDEAADYVLVGGGLGIPPLLEAAQSLIRGRSPCSAIVTSISPTSMLPSTRTKCTASTSRRAMCSRCSNVCGRHWRRAGARRSFCPAVRRQ